MREPTCNGSVGEAEQLRIEQMWWRELEDFIGPTVTVTRRGEDSGVSVSTANPNRTVSD